MQFIQFLLFYSFLIPMEWGLGIGDWGLGNPQSPIPNPQIEENKYYYHKVTTNQL